MTYRTLIVLLGIWGAHALNNFPSRRLRSTSSLKYEVVDSLSLSFDVQLVASAGLIGVGSYLDGQDLVPPSTVAMEVFEDDSGVREEELPDKKVDIYRDTVLRYAGYLNEVGEAFRPLVPGQVVIFSYVLAITYVLADAVSKGGECAEEPKNVGITGCGVAAVIDTLSFQFIASIIIPGTIINRWVTLVSYLSYVQIDIAGKMSTALGVAHDSVLASVGGVDVTCDAIASSTPTALGLALIPVIVAPIDALTEKFLDEVVRPILVKQFPRCSLPFAENDEDACGRESPLTF